MRKLLFTSVVLVFFVTVKAQEITRIEPAFWWVDMKTTELQMMVYGKGIARSEFQFDYPGVYLKEIVRTENPNYLFIYLDITKETKPGVMNLTFTEGRRKVVKTFELKPRAKTPGAQGFDQSDVMYLIMPDRFANGDTSNDVWDDVPINRNEPGGRHGGDLAGIEQRLDYLSDLGITTIWLNPVLENKMPRGSYHGYATTDFYRVDPRFGSNEDYCRMIEKAHQKGIKIVMDMIYNHCGSYHWWMNDFPTKDWLNHQQTGFVPTTHNLYTIMDPYAPQSEIAAMTDGWFVASMPDLNQRNRLLADYLIQNSIWWIEYARIDGIRHDTHPYADFDFMARWGKRLEEEYPAFNMVGEAWYTNNGAAPLAWWQQNSRINKQQTCLKSVMDFNLMETYNRVFNIKSPENNPWRRIYEVIAQDYLYEDIHNVLVFLDNHDLSRFMKAEETDLARFKQAIAFLLTTRGIPQLYYGTEILMTGEKSEGDGNLRKDFPGGWPGDTTDAFTAAGRTRLQNEAFDFMRKLLQWRKTNPAITQGNLIHYAPDNRLQTYVYARSKDNHHVLVVLNGSNREVTLPLNRYADVLHNKTSGRDVISNRTIVFENEIQLAPKEVLVLEMR